VIVNSSFVPLEGGVHAEVLDRGEVRRRWESVLGGLRDFLLVLKGEGGPLDPELVADAISLYFKSAINRPLYGIWMYSPYLLLLYKILIDRKAPVEKVNLLDDLLRAQADQRIGKLVRILEEKREDLDWCILHIPADTRPLYNSSSLVLHLLLTSAVAAVRAGDRDFLHRLRIASLLHDIGKPMDYRRHVVEGVRLARDLLRDILSPEDVDFVVGLIEEHHSREYGGPALRILKEADRMASGRDRLSDIAERIDLRSILNRHIPGFEYDKMISGDWSPVEKADPELLKRASEEAILEINKLMSGQGGVTGGVATDDVYYYRIDIHGIQNYIREAHKLKSLQAGSFLVDLLVISVIPILLKFGAHVHPENVLVSGGGFVEFIGPKGIDLDPILSFYRRNIVVEHLGRLLRIYGNLGCSWASVPLGPLISETRKRIMAEIGMRKVRVKAEPIDPVWTRERCVDCGFRPAELDVEGEGLCEYCAAKRIVGERYSFSIKWRHLRIPQLDNARPKDVFEVDSGKALEDLMKILAGGLPGEKVKLNYSVIKVDGNRIGAFISSAVSVSDLFQRSFRIDRALKNALEETLRKLKECDPRDAARLVIGTMYAGGDDALLVVPSRISLQVAESLLENFRSGLGGAVTMGAAIISVPEKHNIWGALDAATWLLEHGKNYDLNGKTGRDVEGGFIAFDYIDRGILDGVSESYREAITSSGIHKRKTVYALSEIKNMNSFISGFLSPASRVIPYCGLGESIEEVKKVKSILLEVLELTKNVGSAELGRAAILTHRAIVRSEKFKNDEHHRKLLINYIVMPFLDGKIPDLLGTLYLIKVLGGGLL